MKSAIREGRTAVTTGPFFTFETADGFTVGDEIKEGENTLKIILDTARQSEIAPSQSFSFREIRLVSNGSKAVKIIPATEKNLTFNFEKGQWYSLELCGDIDEKTNKYCKFILAFNDGIPSDIFDSLPLVNKSQAEKFVTGVFEGDENEIKEALLKFGPVVIEQIPVDFEEAFISEVSKNGKL